jgi:hypothetical protein
MQFSDTVFVLYMELDEEIEEEEENFCYFMTLYQIWKLYTDAVLTAANC